MRRSRILRHLPAWLALMAVFSAAASASAAERSFPFDSELLLDVRPMKGSKRVPVIGVGPKGEAAIEHRSPGRSAESCEDARHRHAPNRLWTTRSISLMPMNGAMIPPTP